MNVVDHVNNKSNMLYLDVSAKKNFPQMVKTRNTKSGSVHCFDFMALTFYIKKINYGNLFNLGCVSLLGNCQSQINLG